MTTDKEQIKKAISGITGKPSYVSLVREDFDFVDPEGMVHVCGNSVDDVLEGLAGEFSELPAELARELLFIRSRSLTMNDLDRINKSRPASSFYKAGLCFDEPKDAAVEVFVFWR